MNDYNWQVSTQHNVASMNIDVFVHRRTSDQDIQFMLADGNTVTRSVGSVMPESDCIFVTLPNHNIAGMLVEQLTSKGVRQPDKSYTEGELEATKRHLSDVRKLIPKLNEERK